MGQNNTTPDTVAVESEQPVDAATNEDSVQTRSSRRQTPRRQNRGARYRPYPATHPATKHTDADKTEGQAAKGDATPCLETESTNPRRLGLQSTCRVCRQKEEKITSLADDVKRLKANQIPKEVFDDMKRKYEAEKVSKDDALRRLSAMASSRLRDNNPNISDLSDENRPTKIAEKFSELYDNQWTDAFDAIDKEKTLQEKQIIQFLLEVLMTSFEECRHIASDNYLEKVQRFLEFPIEPIDYRKESLILPAELKQNIKDFRKARAPYVVEQIYEAIRKQLPTQYDHLAAVQAYSSACASLCWLMAVQDPSLVLECCSTDKFDNNMFKDYTKRGPFVEFVVWPALLLHKDGPLLAKGVAQGCIKG